MSAASPALPSLVAGDVIGGKYVLDKLLGRGGMGAVYAARQTNLNNRAVAIKVMLADPGNEEARQRFLNEGGAAATLRSEHVVQVFDLGSERGFEYMVLELLEGEDLSQVLERGVLSPPQAVGYVIQALRGLVEAHRHGIVHRDLKPSNLFLARRPDGSSVLKILDFGISKANVQGALGQSPGQLTSTKAMLGSPLYMSPEQLRSSKSVDARADLWAVGVILYELMTGHLPYMGESLGELFASILENEPVPPRNYQPAISPALEQVILRCLQKRPEHRFATAQELLDVLTQIASGASLPSMMAATALPPGQPPQGASQSSPGFHSSPRMQSSPQMPGMAMTPSNYGPPPGMPPMASTTGSGANMPVVKSTVPLGASTPGVGESVAWAPPKKTNPAVFVVSGVAIVALLGIGAFFGVRAKTSGATGAGASGSASASASAPVVATATPPPSASTLPSASAAPIETAAATATTPPVAETHATKPKTPPATTATGTHRTTTTTKPAETPVANTPPPPPATATKPKDPPSIGVNSR